MSVTIEDVKKALFREVQTGERAHKRTKITIVGVGQVGMAAAVSILHKGIARDLALVDVIGPKLEGERMDLQHGAALIHPITVHSSENYEVTKNSDICIISAGVRQQPDEPRVALVQRNVPLLKKIVPELVKYSPHTILLVVSNPVDILTWVVWKISGLPASRVVGSGTTLDSSRFRFMLAEKLDVSPKSVHGYFIGEHGDSSVPLWSAVSVGGVLLRSLFPDIGKNGDEWDATAKKVIKSAYDVIAKKGYTSSSIGMCVSVLCSAILHDTNEVYPVSTSIKGLYGIEEDVFVSLPSVLAASGVRDVVRVQLDQTELRLLKESVQAMLKIQKECQLD